MSVQSEARDLEENLMTAEGAENKQEAIIAALVFLLRVSQSHEKSLATLFSDRV